MSGGDAYGQHICDARSVSGAYCAAPAVIPHIPVVTTASVAVSANSNADGGAVAVVADALDPSLVPAPVEVALCSCDKKADDGTSVCRPAEVAVCANKFGCLDSLHPSMLGRAIRQGAAASTDPEVYAGPFPATPSLQLQHTMCRCNAGGDYGLDVASYTCSDFGRLYRRKQEPGYYTASARWANAADEFDWHVTEVVDYVLAEARAEVSALQARQQGQAGPPLNGVEAFQLAQKSADLLAYQPKVKEMVCAMVFPRCAHCKDVVDDPVRFFGGNERSTVCFDPTTCRAVCNSTLRSHASLRPRLVDCVLNGRCEHASHIWHTAARRDRVSGAIRDDVGRLCEDETFGHWRSINGSHQPDVSVDPRASYGRHDPTAASFTIAIVVAGLVVGMSTLCLVCAHYWTDRWKLKRESGAGEFYVSDNYVAREGDGTAAPATAGHTPADFSFDSFAGGRGTDAEAAAGGAD